MAVSYTELAGSPKIHMDRHGGSATRMIRVEWRDYVAALDDFFILPKDGYARFPGIEWLIAQSVDVEPIHPEGIDPNASVPATYTKAGARLTIQYGVPSEDQLQQSGHAGGDRSGPGGNDGSTGGQDVSFVKHTVSIGGEFLQWPADGLEWELGGTVNADPKNPKAKDTATRDNLMVGTIIPIIEHSITWSFVQWPPWPVIRQTVGRINASTFAGAPPGTLLFLGVEGEREVTNKGVKSWTLHYKFSEKNYTPDDPTASQGWNYFLRPETGRFERIVKKPIRTNGVKTTVDLNGAITAGATTLTINVFQNNSFPRTPPFLIMIDKEIILVVAVNTPVWTIKRARNGTVAAAHANGAAITEAKKFIYDSTDFTGLFPQSLLPPSAD